MVIKKDESREVYERSKLEKGILHSCHKRPVSSQQIDSMVDEIETQIFNMEEKEVSSSAIGELVMKSCRRSMRSHMSVSPPYIVSSRT